MFYIFDENVIKLTRGNSALIDITPIDNSTGAPFILSEGDKVLFTVKSKSGEKVLQKVLTNENYGDEEDTSLNCEITQEDTINLITGEYYYDCLLLTSDDQAVTFISSSLVIQKAIGTANDLGPSGGETNG